MQELSNDVVSAVDESIISLDKRVLRNKVIDSGQVTVGDRRQTHWYVPVQLMQILCTRS